MLKLCGTVPTFFGSAGTVFRHKKHGYKGVIYAWDKQCDRFASCCITVHKQHCVLFDKAANSE